MASFEDVWDPARFVDAQSATLLLFARQWNEREAEDIVQTALLKFLAECEKKKTPENPLGWLFSVVRNEAISRLRRRKTQTLHNRLYAGHRPQWFEAAHESRLDAQTVVERLKQLPLEYREIIVAKIWGERSFEEIAALVGSSRSAVHRKYVEGLRLLKSMVQK